MYQYAAFAHLGKRLISAIVDGLALGLVGRSAGIPDGFTLLDNCDAFGKRHELCYVICGFQDHSTRICFSYTRTEYLTRHWSHISDLA